MDVDDDGHPVQTEEHSNSLAKSVKSVWGVFDAETQDNKLVELAVPNRYLVWLGLIGTW